MVKTGTLLGISLCSIVFSCEALIIQLNDIGGAAPGTQAGDGFLKAANIWESFLSDPITINLDVGFSVLSPNVLGQTQSYKNTVPYAQVRDALIQNATSDVDISVINHLPKDDSLIFLSNYPNGNLYLDNNHSANNLYLTVNRANLKALGLLGETTTPDASIQFSTLYNYDFEQSNGISSSLFDFVGIATHEIGHALGFVSGMDIVDYYSGLGPNNGQIASFDPYSIFTTLDLFKYSDRSLAYGEGIQDLAIGDAGQYFSIDGGATLIAHFSTGVYNGDGLQTSHWTDNQDVGIMDPTLAASQMGVITQTDLIALDAIGYDIKLNQTPSMPVPNPTTLSLFGLGLFFMRCYLRKSALNGRGKDVKLR